MIDWTNPDCKVSNYFSVRECLWLPTWNRMATEDDGLNDDIKDSLVKLCTQMDLVRDFLGQPISVHVTYRPEEYNKLIGGASNSAHKYGQAMDWSIVGDNCDDLRAKLEPQLEQWNMRMEKLPGSNWVHLDIRELAPGGNRYFKP